MVKPSDKEDTSEKPDTSNTSDISVLNVIEMLRFTGSAVDTKGVGIDVSFVVIDPFNEVSFDIVPFNVVSFHVPDSFIDRVGFAAVVLVYLTGECVKVGKDADVEVKADSTVAFGAVADETDAVVGGKEDDALCFGKMSKC